MRLNEVPTNIIKQVILDYIIEPDILEELLSYLVEECQTLNDDVIYDNQEKGYDWSLVETRQNEDIDDLAEIINQLLS